MELEALLAEAKSASPLRRIEWRDQIAAYGDQGIQAVSPWLADETLAAFAVRVIDRAGLDGHPDAATRALQDWRKRAPEGVRDDIAWALRRIKVASQPEAPKPVKPLPVQAARVRPRSTTAARRRPQ
jgi:hypothetical protein